MKNFYEWLNDENFNNWLISERHSKKDQRELEKKLTEAGFTKGTGRDHDKWFKDGIGVTVSRGSNLPPNQIFNSVMRDWKNNVARIEALQRRRAV